MKFVMKIMEMIGMNLVKNSLNTSNNMIFFFFLIDDEWSQDASNVNQSIITMNSENIICERKESEKFIKKRN